jgi:drug/metabolite transporter (DMT)-like permease
VNPDGASGETESGTHSHRGPGLGAAAGLFSAFLFGAGVPITKRLLPEVEPLLLAGLLYLGGGLAVSLGRLVAGARLREARLARGDLPRVLAVVVLGGIVGPLALVNGLRTVSGVSGALLLNLEGPLTVVVALAFFGEHLGRRGVAAALTVFLAAALLVIPGKDGQETSVAGVLLLLVACGAWAVDNNLTQTLTSKDPWQLVMAKTLGAGSCMVVLGLLLGGALPSPGTAGKALALGGLSYGVSVLLDAYALRLLGAAREAAYFATAPFAGALLSMPILGEPLRGWQLSSGLLMAIGVALLLRERHSHDHSHPALEHTHRHVHDGHHQHVHSPDVDPTEPHAHPHRHAPLTHSHPHVSDLHHRHPH